MPVRCMSKCSRTESAQEIQEFADAVHTMLKLLDKLE